MLFYPLLLLNNVDTYVQIQKQKLTNFKTNEMFILSIRIEKLIKHNREHRLLDYFPSLY